MSDGKPSTSQLKTISTEHPIWDRFFTVNPLVVIGTLEVDGNYDLAPKHMAIPMGWNNYFGFICTSRHNTYTNIQHEKEFSVSYPKPTQAILTSLTASPRCEDQTKPIVEQIPTVACTQINSICLRDATIHLECKLHKIIDEFGENSLITGTIIEARVEQKALRRKDRDDHYTIEKTPLLAYLNPGQYSIINQSNTFPFPKNFSR